MPPKQHDAFMAAVLRLSRPPARSDVAQPSGMEHYDMPSCIFTIILATVWPLLVNSTFKCRLRLVCRDACSAVDDLHHPAKAQLRATGQSRLTVVMVHPQPAGATAPVFRPIQHLQVLDTRPSDRLPLLLDTLAPLLCRVTHLDLHAVNGLSAACATAVVACMPQLAHLTFSPYPIVAPIPTPTFVSPYACRELAPVPRAAPLPCPTPPHTHFYAGLAALPALASLSTYDLDNAGVLACSGLLGLTRLWLLSSRVTAYEPLSQLHQLRSLHIDAGPAIPWVSSLANLEHLRCGLLDLDTVRALQPCTRLSSLSSTGLDDFAWLCEVAAPAEGQAPPLSLPALTELTLSTDAAVDELRGLLRSVSLPSLLHLRVTSVMRSNSMCIAQCIADVREVVARTPLAVAAYQVLVEQGEEEESVSEMASDESDEDEWRHNAKGRHAERGQEGGDPRFWGHVLCALSGTQKVAGRAVEFELDVTAVVVDEGYY